MINAKPLQTLTKNFSVLYVEDNDQLLDQMSMLLSNFFDDLETATNGQEGLDKYKEREFDLVITDVRMPVMNGIEMAKRIKAINSSQMLLVISAHDDSDQLMDLLNVGVDHFLLKPVDPTKLMLTLQSACQQVHDFRKHMERVVKQESCLTLMNEGTFLFQTLNEADDLSRGLSSLFPDNAHALIGLTELFYNAVEHGNLGITYDEKTILKDENRWRDEVIQRLALPENQSKYVRVHYEKTKDHLKIIVEDEGIGFDYNEFLVMSPDRLFDNHGRGIAVAKALYFSELTYFDPGNKVEALVYLEP